MGSARTEIIDHSSVTKLSTCPVCGERDLSTDEVLLRTRLLNHLTIHGPDGYVYRDLMKRWLRGQGVAA